MIFFFIFFATKFFFVNLRLTLNVSDYENKSNSYPTLDFIRLFAFQ